MNELKNIKGIGPKTIGYLNKLNINNIDDLRYVLDHEKNMIKELYNEYMTTGKVEKYNEFVRSISSYTSSVWTSPNTRYFDFSNKSASNPNKS